MFIFTFYVHIERQNMLFHTNEIQGNIHETFYILPELTEGILSFFFQRKPLMNIQSRTAHQNPKCTLKCKKELGG